MTLNIVVQYYADLSFNANFRQSFRRFWRWIPDRGVFDMQVIELIIVAGFVTLS